MWSGGALAILALGFGLGLKHALDADHVVAVSTIVTRSRSMLRSAAIGALWGVGHTSTLLVMGFAVLVLRLAIPDRMALAMEFGVGVLLVGLGVNVMRSHISGWWHRHVHGHDDTIDEQEHEHRHLSLGAHQHQHAGRSPRMSVLVGMVHGMAGSAALLLLILTTIDSVVQGLVYILVFGVGSILGMLIMSTLIGLPFVFTARRFEGLNEKITLGAGTFSIVLGVFIMAQIGFVEGLIYRM